MNATERMSTLTADAPLVDPFVAEAALKLRDALKYTALWAKSKNRDLWLPLFRRYATDRKAYRIYLPVSQAVVKKPRPVVPPADVVAALKAKGYAVEDYLLGIATSADGRRRVKIGKLVADNPEALKSFANDPRRKAAVNSGKAEGMLVVISRHPVDVAGMSTGRGWTSCMNLDGGINKRYVAADVKQGSLVAYFVKADDKNIQRPKGRVLIKPLVGPKGQRLLAREDTVYGTANASFLHTVDAWLRDVNKDVGSGAFKLPASLYNDSDLNDVNHWRIEDVRTPKDAMQFLLHSDDSPRVDIDRAVKVLGTDLSVAQEYVDAVLPLRGRVGTRVIPELRDAVLKEAAEIRVGPKPTAAQVNRIAAIARTLSAFGQTVPDRLYDLAVGPHTLEVVSDLMSTGKKGFAKADEVVKRLLQQSDAVLKATETPRRELTDLFRDALDYCSDKLKARWPALEELCDRMPNRIPDEEALAYAVNVARCRLPLADAAFMHSIKCDPQSSLPAVKYLSVCTKVQRAALIDRAGVDVLWVLSNMHEKSRDWTGNDAAVREVISRLATLPAAKVARALDDGRHGSLFDYMPDAYKALVVEALCKNGLYKEAAIEVDTMRATDAATLCLKHPEMLAPLMMYGDGDVMTELVEDHNAWPALLANLTDMDAAALFRDFSEVKRVRDEFFAAAVRAKKPGAFFLKVAKTVGDRLDKAAEAYLKKADVRAYSAYLRYLREIGLED